MTNIPHNVTECMCPACVFVRESEPPQLEGLSYLNKSSVVRVLSFEKKSYGSWTVNIAYYARPGYEKYFLDGPKLENWSVEMWNKQVRQHKGIR